METSSKQTNKDMVDDLEILQELSSEIDFELGSVGIAVSDLADVETLFGQLVTSMNEAENNGKPIGNYREHHTKLRVYWGLMRYSLEFLTKEHEKAQELNYKLLNKIEQLMSEKSPVAGNDETLIETK